MPFFEKSSVCRNISDISPQSIYKLVEMIKSVNFWCSKSTKICPKVRFVLSISLNYLQQCYNFSSRSNKSCCFEIFSLLTHSLSLTSSMGAFAPKDKIICFQSQMMHDCRIRWQASFLETNRWLLILIVTKF